MADLVFDCIGARPDRYAVVPTLLLALRIGETTGETVHAIALRCQLRIEPQRRRYTDAEAQRLEDLFGDTSRWADTLKPLQLATLSTMVPGFAGSIEIDLPLPCTYDLEVASAKYFAGLDSGEVPLLLLFSGTVFTKGERGFSVSQVPWSKEASYRLPVQVWREMVDLHFPGSAWIRVQRDTMGDLQRFKSSRALTTWDSTVAALLAEAGQRQR